MPTHRRMQVCYDVFQYIYYMYSDIYFPIWTGCAAVLVSTEPLDGMPDDEDPARNPLLVTSHIGNICAVE